MKYSSLNRRMFLQGAAGSMAIPFLPSLLPKAEAATTSPAKFVHLTSQFGLPRRDTIPLYSTPTAVATTQRDQDTRVQSLKDIVQLKGSMSYVLGSAWNPYLSKVNVITNCNAYIGNDMHSWGIQATASSNSKDGAGPLGDDYFSVDYLVEQAFAKQGASPLSALRINLAQNGVNYYNPSTCWGPPKNGSTMIPMLMTLEQVKQKLMGVSGTAVPDSKKTNRRLVIDNVLKDFQAVMGNRRISSVDKNRLSTAADMWRDFETKLGQNPALTCSVPNFTDPGLRWLAAHRLGLDAAVLALQCGMTRVVSYNIDHMFDVNPGIDTHAISHDPRNQPKGLTDTLFADCGRFRGELFTYLLKRLSETQDEAGNPLIESSLVSWGHEYSGLGHSRHAHTMIMAGGANGRVETGLHIDAGGAPINKYYLTNMMALGLSLSDIERGGRAGFGEYTSASIGREEDSSFGQPGVWREYTAPRQSFFAQTEERRKPFFYLKG